MSKEYRKLDQIEKDIILNMQFSSSVDELMVKSNIDAFLVKELGVDGTKSLLFWSNKKRKKGDGSVRTVAEIITCDVDNVPVWFTLLAFSDNSGELCELDIWKVDYSPLKDLARCLVNYLGNGKKDYSEIVDL
jgi:hypothetical protein